VNRIPAAVLFRSEVVSWFLIIVVAAATVVVVALNVGAAFVVPHGRNLWGIILFIVLVDGFALANFYKLVVTFDGREVVYRFGLFRKRIPLAEMTAVEVINVKWISFGGVGIRLAPGGWGWITGSGPAVRITTAKRAYYANVDRPAFLADIISNYERAARGRAR
jgi:hypothetical protein